MALALVGQADRAAETLAAHDALNVAPLVPNETDILQARAWTRQPPATFLPPVTSRKRQPILANRSAT